jgi:ribonuclease HII
LAIQERISTYSFGEASAAEIDVYGIRRATHLAMLRAYWQLLPTPTVILMDGESATIPIFSKTFQYNYGDQRHFVIAAASILAKEYRDEKMRHFHEQYPEYGFDRHVGYGTAFHYEAIKAYGTTPLHRKLFLRSLSRH